MCVGVPAGRILFHSYRGVRYQVDHASVCPHTQTDRSVGSSCCFVLFCWCLEWMIVLNLFLRPPSVSDKLLVCMSQSAQVTMTTFVTLTWPLTQLRFLITGLSLDYYDGRKEPVSWLIFFCLLDGLSVCLGRLSLCALCLCLCLCLLCFLL